MEIDSFLERFTVANESRLGVGPEQPNQPDTELAACVDTWLALHPFLRADPDYVAYLKRYAGAELTDRTGHVDIYVHGFTGIGGDLGEIGPNEYDFDNPSIDPDGFYQFALIEFDEEGGEDVTRLNFLFDGTGRRPWGVYRGVYPAQGEVVVGDWFCRTFLEWLELAYEGKAHSL